MDMLFVSGGVFNVAAGVGEAGQPQRSDGRDLGGDPDRGMDD